MSEAEQGMIMARSHINDGNYAWTSAMHGVGNTAIPLTSHTITTFSHNFKIKNHLCLLLFLSQLIKKPLCFSQSLHPRCILEVSLTRWQQWLIVLCYALLIPCCCLLHSRIDRFSTRAVSDTWMLPSYQQNRALLFVL